MSLPAGHLLSYYEVLAPLGAGAMGEVYRARDTRLEREVAIKVLSEHFAADEERLRRFEREAKTLAALNHPNVAGIHGIDQVGDTCFLAMELVPGEDLAERLGRGSMPLDEGLDIARQIAEGLEAAHEAGIVHRDLKPANIRVTPDGVVKLLDFGLAKPIRPVTTKEGTTSAQSDSFLVTSEGMILGTPTYMSPEQARGKPVDKRTDIWAFGCVLYECLTGKRAFAGDTFGDLVVAILEHEPDLEALPVRTPAHLRQLLARTFIKDPRARLRDIGEARLALGPELELELEAEGDGASGAAGGTRHRGTLVGVVLALVAGLVAGEVFRGGGEGRAAPALAVPTSFRQVSDLPGPERQPSLSPDGRSLLYVYSTEDGDADIYLQRVEGRTPINLTADSPFGDSAPAFSPDGERIAFRSEREGGGIFVMGATGESVRRVVDFGHEPAWSPDGLQLAVTTERFVDPLSRMGISELWVVAADGSDRRRLTAGDAMGAAWSPDGRRIAYWGWREPDWQRDLFTIAVDGSEDQGVLVTDDLPVDWSPVWSSEGDALYFSSNRGGTMNLWRIGLDPGTGLPTSSPVPMTTAATWSGSYSVSANGRRIAYATRDEQTDVLTVDIDPESGEVSGIPKPIFGGRGIREIDWSPSGDRLVIAQSGRPWESLAIIRADGTGYTRITDASVQHRNVRWQPAPGSERILYTSDRNLCTMRSDGSDIQVVVDEDKPSFGGFWSTDGRQVLSNDIDESWRIGNFRKYELEAGGEFRALDWSASMSPELEQVWLDAWSSRTDRALVAGDRASRTPGLYMIELETGAVRQLYDQWLVSFGCVFMPDDKSVLFKREDQIELVDLDTLERRLVLEVEQDNAGAGARGMSLSRDGRKLAILARRDEGNIWIADLESTSSEP